MKIIKRNGSEAVFDSGKILTAIGKANSVVSDAERLTDAQIEVIVKNVTDQCKEALRAVNVEEIQDMVEDQLMASGAYMVARRYITYR